MRRGEDTKQGQQSSASEPGSAASLHTKLPLSAPRAALKQPQRRAGGREGHLGSSIQQKGSPLLLDQLQSTLCPCHGLTCFPAWRAQVAGESDLSLQQQEGCRKGFLHRKEQMQLLIIQRGLWGQRSHVPLCNLLLKLRAAAASRAAAWLPALPQTQLVLLPAPSALRKHSALKGEAGKALHNLTNYNASKTVWGGVCQTP